MCGGMQVVKIYHKKTLRQRRTWCRQVQGVALVSLWDQCKIFRERFEELKKLTTTPDTYLVGIHDMFEENEHLDGVDYGFVYVGELSSTI